MAKKRPDRESQNWELSEFCKAGDLSRADMQMTKLVLDDFPYPHTDVWVYDAERGEKLVFGVPRDHELGMAFYVIDQEGCEEIQKRPDISEFDVTKEERPNCIAHGEACVLTKHFNFSGVSRLQFKCPECYLTRYIDL